MNDPWDESLASYNVHYAIFLSQVYKGQSSHKPIQMTTVYGKFLKYKYNNYLLTKR